VAFTVAPDWVCEVLSPSTARFDRAQKLPLYAAAGVKHAWLIDPLQRTVEVLRLTGEGKYLLVITVGGSASVRLEPFDAVDLELGLLWGEGGG